MGATVDDGSSGPEKPDGPMTDSKVRRTLSGSFETVYCSRFEQNLELFTTKVQRNRHHLTLEWALMP